MESQLRFSLCPMYKPYRNSGTSFFFLSVFSANMERINKESATVSLYRGLEWHPESSGGKWKKQNGYVPSKICFSMLCSYHMVGEK